MKDTTLGLILLGAVLVVGGFLFLTPSVASGTVLTGNAVKVGREDQQVILNEQPRRAPGPVQEITISQKNFNYDPSSIKVKAGQPVRIALDEKVGGCLRAFTIRDLGISKYVPTPNDVIEFTPRKKGTFTFSCSMGMGYGKLIVE